MTDVASLDLKWLRGRAADWSRTIVEIELIAAEVLARDEEGSVEWASNYIKTAGTHPHNGDCNQCRAWLTGPWTCDACVYDEYMLKAWAKKREAVDAAALALHQRG